MIAARALPLAAALLIGCSAGAQPDGPQTNTVAPAATPDGRLAEAQVGGRTLRLVTEGGQCALAAGAAPVPLGLAAPCGFLRPKAGAAAWVHDYGPRGAVVLVGGPPATAVTADSGRTAADRCSDVGRAVIVAEGKVGLSEIKRSAGWFCPDAAPDEKYYYGIAHDPAGRTPVG
ncbi:hypothetical protein [Sphingomonas sp.]|jgi:hypothetical protein|uniref:hypothetical protein n=1 Tax=Sphingomonas sp. TaxID=28214 RepID=UPI002D7FA054|nr:hypothetical protein [Sphingomonas sp.]HEU0045556.1 hypothetical protein [Sphingomonas sp.]